MRRRVFVAWRCRSSWWLTLTGSYKKLKGCILSISIITNWPKIKVLMWITLLKFDFAKLYSLLCLVERWFTKMSIIMSYQRPIIKEDTALSFKNFHLSHTKLTLIFLVFKQFDRAFNKTPYYVKIYIVYRTFQCQKEEIWLIMELYEIHTYITFMYLKYK